MRNFLNHSKCFCGFTIRILYVLNDNHIKRL